MSLRFQYLCFKRFSLYFKDFTCHCQSQSVSYGSYNNLETNQKSHVTTLMEEAENMRFKTLLNKIFGFQDF